MKKLKFLIIILILGFSLGIIRRNDFNNMTVVQASPIKDEREFKAVWVTPITDISYNGVNLFKSEMNTVLDVMEHYGLNALIFHVRTHNNALYPSAINPQAKYISNINFNSFDPLDWLIAETHKRGIEFHAWMNPYRYAANQQVGAPPQANPQSDLTNTLEGKILNPALSVVKNHIYDTVDEFVGLYPNVDAIHFDDYFYVTTNAEPTNSNSRRAHITEMIEGVKSTLDNFNQTNNKSIQFGISPTGIYKNGSGSVTYDGNGNPITDGSNTNGQQHYESYLYADTVKWAIDGSIDYLLPQTYWAKNHPAASYTSLINWWNDVFKNLDVNLYSGLGVYMADSTSTTYGWKDDMNELLSQLDLLDNLNKVEGYSIFSYKHLKRGYDDSSYKSAQQIINAYNNPLRTKVRVLPEVRSMTPVIPGEVNGVNHSNGTLTWQQATNAKFYYIYRSLNEVSYSSDEIIGVVGNGDLTFITGDTNNVYNYGVRSLSQTNHLSEVVIEEPLETYTIDYVLDDGEFISDYESRDEMITDFLTDFYNFLVSQNELNETQISVTDFMHNTGNMSGFDGIYDGEHFETLYNVNDKSINPSTNKFINQPEYNKWVPLLDLIDDYVKVVNSTQSFWGSRFEGKVRIKDFFQGYNYGKIEADPLLNQIPSELEKGIKIITEYNELTEVTLPTPEKVGSTFLGWYNNSSFNGNSITKINVGTTGNKTFYAKWELDGETPTNVTINFDLGYDNLSLNSETIPYGEKVTKPNNPTRNDYIFLGWYLNEQLFDYNSFITEDLNLIAKWKKVEVTITFDVAGGTPLISPQTIDKGLKASLPTEPTKAGFIFLGWYLEETEYDFNSIVVEDITLVAKWEEIIITYDVTFVAGGGTPEPPIQTINEFDKVIEPTSPTKEGYVFLGWYIDILGNPYDFNSEVTSDLLLEAKWEEESVIEYVTVSFVNDGGINPDEKTIIKGRTLETLPEVSKEGFTFLGWYLNSSLFVVETSITEDITLTAKWEEITIEGLITSVNGASIRTDGIQGLRFYAQICNEQKTNPHGFYLIYGKASKEDLQQAINNTSGQIYLNNKIVHKVNVPGSSANNMFSIVLTGIPLKGYLDSITVIPYVEFQENIILADEPVTRSIFDVAAKGYKQDQLFTNIISDINNNLYSFDESNLTISKETVYSLDVNYLKEEFINDWNTKFNTTWTDLQGNAFYNSASTGGSTNIINSKDLSDTNLYKFFNDQIYKDKWDWLLNYLKSIDITIHTTRQVIALLGNGKHEINDGYSNPRRLYNGDHLSYSIVNFFNKTHEKGGYTAVNFTIESNYETLKLFNNKIIINDFLSKNYLMENSSITLKELQESTTGLTYKYYDGVNYYNENEDYLVTGEVQFTIELINPLNKDEIIYNLNGGDFYQYSNRVEMVNDFILDFNTYFSNEDDIIALEFQAKTYEWNVYTFFEEEPYLSKWGWLKTYLINIADEQLHGSLTDLLDNHDNTWRGSIDSFLNETVRTEWPSSADYSIEPAKNGFWDVLLTDEVPLVYDFEAELILPVPQKIGYTFVGWYLNEDFTSNIVTKIELYTTGNVELFAKWISE